MKLSCTDCFVFEERKINSVLCHTCLLLHEKKKKIDQIYPLMAVKKNQYFPFNLHKRGFQLILLPVRKTIRRGIYLFLVREAADGAGHCWARRCLQHNVFPIPATADGEDGKKDKGGLKTHAGQQAQITLDQ